MFALSFSKILLTVLVIVVVWRGYRMYLQLQSAGSPASGERQRPRPPARRHRRPPIWSSARAAACSCRNGTICRSVERVPVPLEPDARPGSP